MMLKDLVQNLKMKQVTGSLDVVITGITQDSRRVEKGHLFVAIPGHQADGHRFIPEAVARGAAGVVISQEPDEKLAIPQVVVDDPRSVLADLAARLYEDPSMNLRVIGITGTNGKTTMTYLLESILREAGRNPGVLGTINYRHSGRIFPSENTTPESADLQRLMAAMLREGVTDVLMEVSSHALAQGRIRGIQFDVGVFTNLSQDHLDYHEDMEDYFQAKLRFFAEYLPESRKKEPFVVLNMEDTRGEEIILMGTVRTIRAALTGPYEVRCQSFDLSSDGIHAEVLVGAEVYDVRSPLLGQFNLENILLAIGVAHGLGFSQEIILAGIKKLQLVPGRLERIPNDRGLHIFVDYAHTPEALARVGENLKRLSRGRLITVFGCGGDRDRSKRPLMGREAGRFSDLVIVTSDNPRTEDPETIMDQIIPGLEEAGFPRERTYRISDRAEALRQAVSLARRDDLLLVAGKGHEDYQIIGKKKVHFSDQEILRELLASEAVTRR